MNVTICERGCGGTSLDPKADIHNVRLIMRVNGDDEEAGFKVAAELCASCRNAVKAEIETMFTLAKVTLEVRKKGADKI